MLDFLKTLYKYATTRTLVSYSKSLQSRFQSDWHRYTEGDEEGAGFWMVPVVFACVHVMTLVGESQLHSARAPPRGRVAIALAHGMRHACLALFIIEVALIASCAAIVATW